MGNYYYAPNHPMKPQRLRLTHSLLLTYKLYRYLEVFVVRSCLAITVETPQGNGGGDGKIPHERVRRFPPQD